MSAPKAGHQTKGSRKGARHQDKRLTPSWFRIPATRRWESDLYVAGRRPDPSRLAPLASIIYSTILGAGTPTPPLPADRFGDVGTREEAKRLFEADPHVRVLMENGAGSPVPGLPAPTFELALRQWPARTVRSTAWYFGPAGTLTRTRPRDHACAGSAIPGLGNFTVLS